MRTATKALILRELESGPCISLDLAEVVGLSQRTVLYSVRQLRRAGKVRIVGWIPNISADMAPLYGLCIEGQTKRDARRPERMSRAVRSKRWRDKKRAAGVRYWKTRAEKKTPPKIDGAKFDPLQPSGESVYS